MSVSIRSIADSLGVNPSTVSRALRGTGQISPEMSRKIREAAQAAGYEVNPLLSKALTLARQPRAQRYRETIAVIAEFPIETGPDYQRYICGSIEARALNLSYKVEVFVLSGKPMHHRQLSRTLWKRGIRGIIILPRVLSSKPRLHFNWKHFAAVEMGRFLWDPLNLNRIETLQYSKTIETFHILRKAGYKRIGMAIEPLHNKRYNGCYYAAYLFMQHQLPPELRIPIPGLIGKWDQASFLHWMKRQKPEVLIVQDAAQIMDWLSPLMLRIPKDLSLFRFNVRDDDPPGILKTLNWSGLKSDQKTQGKRAMDMLAHMLENGEIGLPESPMCWQVEGFWLSGKTLSRPIGKFITDRGYLKTKMHHYSDL